MSRTVSTVPSGAARRVADSRCREQAILFDGVRARSPLMVQEQAGPTPYRGDDKQLPVSSHAAEVGAGGRFDDRDARGLAERAERALGDRSRIGCDVVE